MPVREITSLCKERGVRVMVDAAHSPGQLPLDVKELGVDYATGKPIYHNNTVEHLDILLCRKHYCPL